MQYLLKKISEAPFQIEPFKHIYIDNFFNDEDFAFLTNNPQLKSSPANSDKVLCEGLATSGWKPIPFPGCTIYPDSYMQ